LSLPLITLLLQSNLESECCPGYSECSDIEFEQSSEFLKVGGLVLMGLISLVLLGKLILNCFWKFRNGQSGIVLI
jgi:hypothetical protein